MIQDIAPHRFDRTYVIGKPDAHDIALCAVSYYTSPSPRDS